MPSADVVLGIDPNKGMSRPDVVSLDGPEVPDSRAMSCPADFVDPNAPQVYELNRGKARAIVSAALSEVRSVDKRMVNTVNLDNLHSIAGAVPSENYIPSDMQFPMQRLGPGHMSREDPVNAELGVPEQKHLPEPVMMSGDLPFFLGGATTGQPYVDQSTAGFSSEGRSKGPPSEPPFALFHAPTQDPTPHHGGDNLSDRGGSFAKSVLPSLQAATETPRDTQ